MSRVFLFIILIIIIFNSFRYLYYIATGPIEAYYFVMLAINLAGMGFGIYHLFFQKKSQKN
ncbi:hypothetical protein M3936_22450 [Sutcliffiella horikoshii]|uniref:hypothetical protein n=1 Tax=Sutcliffiella horikoshii TaxID=79883 RepID=UPI0007D08D29|nr:hypothetical protein [Sutcliffiella horikoshii]MCM3620320.1 hypothetical protein [Sutcliffiella horikoshii]